MALHAIVRRSGSKARVAAVRFDGDPGAWHVEGAAHDVQLALLSFLCAAHVTRLRDENGLLVQRSLPAGTDEHAALRLDALPAIGFYAVLEPG